MMYSLSQQGQGRPGEGIWPLRRLVGAGSEQRDAMSAPRGPARGRGTGPGTGPGGLYDPSFEHDACGVAFVADLASPPSHETVKLGLTALENLAHRGAFGADTESGDGAGILLQMPDRLFRDVVGVTLPAPGSYGSGVVFLPSDAATAARMRRAIAALARKE
ncbi:MAG: hypothetical protein ACRDZ5_03210, partial [Acidimicrobiales bacterium]